MLAQRRVLGTLLPSAHLQEAGLIDLELQLEPNPAILQFRGDRLGSCDSRGKGPIDAAQMVTDSRCPGAGQRLQILLRYRFQGQQSCTQRIDRKSTRLNSSHVKISYAVFCLKKKKDTH